MVPSSEESWERHCKEQEARIRELEAKVRMHRDKADGTYWVWQGDGEDHLESLACPVLIQPSTLQRIVSERDAAVKRAEAAEQTATEQHEYSLRQVEMRQRVEAELAQANAAAAAMREHICRERDNCRCGGSGLVEGPLHADDDEGELRACPDCKRRNEVLATNAGKPLHAMHNRGVNLTAEEWIVEKLRQGTLLLHNCVDLDPEIRGSVPVLKDTRIPISRILAELADGLSVSEIADDFEIDAGLLKNLLDGIASCLAAASRIEDLKKERDAAVKRAYWVWQGGGADHLESLVCPVLIRPEQLRAILADAEEAKDVCNELISRLRHETDKRSQCLPGSPKLIDELVAQLERAESRALPPAEPSRREPRATR